MIDVQKLLGQFLGTHGTGAHRGSHPGPHGGSGGSFLGGSAGSAVQAAIASGLASKLFRAKGLGRMGGSAGKFGSAALVAGLAYKAFQAYQQNRSGPGHASASPQRFTDLPDAGGTAFLPRGEEERHARLMLSAMIAAAKADGYIDRDEEAAIFGRIDEAGLDAAEKGYLMDEMRRPLSIDDLVAKTRGPEEAAEVYTASLLAIDPDHPAERAYLDLLAARLGLDPALAAEIRRTTDAARDS